MNTLLPEKTVIAEDAVTEKDLEQSLPDMIEENSVNQNLLLDI